MQPSLTQDQLNALLRKAQGGVSSVRNEAPQDVAAFELGKSGQMSAAQSRGVAALHERCAQRIGMALSAFLRAGFEAKPGALEQISYGEFQKRLPDLAYLVLFRIPSLEASCLLQIDLALVFPMIDLILGGTGEEQTELRDITDIEEEIFETVTRIVGAELKEAWLPVLEIDFHLERRLLREQASTALPASEKIVSLEIEAQLGATSGKLALAFSSVLSTAVLRKLSAQISSEPVNSQRNQARLQELLLDSQFSLELMLPTSTVSVRELFALEPGGVLLLQPRVSDPIQLNVAGKKMFLAVAVGANQRRAAQVQKILSIVPEQGKETK